METTSIDKRHMWVSVIGVPHWTKRDDLIAVFAKTKKEAEEKTIEFSKKVYPKLKSEFIGKPIKCTITKGWV